MNKEIGSEFWEVEVNQESKPNSEKIYEFLLTGRTALDYLIKDIKKTKELEAIYMPTYCCHTMIQPFLDNGVAVKFYEVNFKNGRYTYEINFETQCDTVLIMQYFGYCNETVRQAIKRLKESGKTIIEDATHSWFSGSPYSCESDYVFASFRKWTGLTCGAIVIKRHASFYASLPSDTNNRYIEIRQQAARLKKQYIEKGEGEKKAFLRMFNQAESLLEADYQNYNMRIDYKDVITRLDVDKIRKKRQVNAKILIEGLKNSKGIECIGITDKDTPLFVPVIVLDGKRDILRQYLINNDVYCPIHWPLSETHKIKDSYLYDNSLSLICDQRYTSLDMKRIIKLINEYFRKEV